MSCTYSEPFAQKNLLDNNLREAIDLILGTNVRTYMHQKYWVDGGNLGVMNLIANDGYIASKEYFLMLQAAVAKLDEKIREVVTVASVPRAQS